MLPCYWQDHVSATEINCVASISAGDLFYVVLTAQKWEKGESNKQHFKLQSSCSPPLP